LLAVVVAVQVLQVVMVVVGAAVQAVRVQLLL
jgi:hypothetical protein